MNHQVFLNKSNLLEFLNVLKNYDPLLEDHLKSLTVFTGSSSTIQNNVIKAVFDIVKDSIKEEINSATFVLIMVYETCDTQCRSQLFRVVYYIQNM